MIQDGLLLSLRHLASGLSNFISIIFHQHAAMMVTVKLSDNNLLNLFTYAGYPLFTWVSNFFTVASNVKIGEIISMIVTNFFCITP